MTTIRLGFEVGTGQPVEIPLKHTAITGQTQEAGKTTALEALISRAGLRAVTFITKRGEASFAGARRIDPYFREQADWQFVASILEASRGEKLKFERAWIIRASKGARSLADVQRNVRKAMDSAKGMSADVYLTLDAYLDVVVPQIAEVRWALSVQLWPGINAMDLTDLSVEMQHLVIKSTLDYVLARHENTVVVVPEAWKFIPQGRGTPVKLAAEAFIRQAAALHNFLWLDSQDIAGVEKIILKSVPLWILGVQREANEIKRTLDNIPAGVAKPSRSDIATLELGQFFACWGRHCVKTYVQPAWATEADAKAIALGQQAIASRPKPKEPTVTEEEARSLRVENANLRQQLADLEGKLARLTGAQPTPPQTSEGVATAAVSLEATMDNERLYQAIKERLVKEAPQLLRLLTVRPEIEVRVERQTIQIDGSTMKGRIARLLADGFYDAGASNSATRAELKRTGPDANNANIGRVLDELKAFGFLTSDGNNYRAVEGMKVNIVEA